MPENASNVPLPDPAPRPPAGYLDAVAGQPILPVARQAWLAAAEQAWSDPARLHHDGRRAGMVLDAARASLATSLGVRPADVFFTSSGPTAVQLALAGLLQARPGPSRVVASAVESLAVLDPARRLADEVDLAPVDSVGRLDLAAFESALNRPTAVACVQAANAEVGTRQPLGDAAAVARAQGVPLVVMAVQVIGRDAVPQDWDVLTASARDWGGPAGVGILVVRPSIRWTPDQNPDRGWVGGFPDIAGAAAAATALEYLAPVAEAESKRLSAMIDRLRHDLPMLVPGLTLAGDPRDRLPHILTFTCAAVPGELLVGELDRRGISVASGSACTADTRMASHVLEAMGLVSGASIRISLPFGCDMASVDALVRELPGAVAAVAERIDT